MSSTTDYGAQVFRNLVRAKLGRGSVSAETAVLIDSFLRLLEALCGSRELSKALDKMQQRLAAELAAEQRRVAELRATIRGEEQPS